TQQIMLRQSIRLAFVAALQRLAPKQRAVLLLVEVLGLSAAETLSTSVASVNSALQRARAAVTNRAGEGFIDSHAELSPEQKELLRRYVQAFEAYDTDTLVSLLREDAILNMPPYALWIQGPREIQVWMNGMGSGCRGSRLIATSACDAPAFGQYRVNPEGGHKAWALVVLELSGDRIAATTSFLDVETLFPRFDLPLTLPA